MYAKLVLCAMHGRDLSEISREGGGAGGGGGWKQRESHNFFRLQKREGL